MTLTAKKTRLAVTNIVPVAAGVRELSEADDDMDTLTRQQRIQDSVRGHAAADRMTSLEAEKLRESGRGNG